MCVQVIKKNPKSRKTYPYNGTSAKVMEIRFCFIRARLCRFSICDTRARLPGHKQCSFVQFVRLDCMFYTQDSSWYSSPRIVGIHVGALHTAFVNVDCVHLLGIDNSGSAVCQRLQVYIWLVYTFFLFTFHMISKIRFRFATFIGIFSQLMECLYYISVWRESLIFCLDARVQTKNELRNKQESLFIWFTLLSQHVK